MKVRWSNQSHGAARYMRIVEPVLYRDAIKEEEKPGEKKKAREIKQKNIIHYVELHDGKLEKVAKGEPSAVFYKQVYLAKDLSKVREQGFGDSLFGWLRGLVESGVARLWSLSGIAMG